MNLIIPENYNPVLSIRETQKAIKYIRDTFQHEFGKEMKLSRISAPLFLEKSSGLNDNLNGVEKPVSFTMKELPNDQIEVVHSLAKWKRWALGHYGFSMHEGLYTNMNAIRKDEEVDNLHSVYVDQWDWEKIISKEERTENVLKQHVRQIFKIIKHMEHEVWYKYPQAVNHLPDDIHFITTQELLDLYPNLNQKERENEITKKYGCVFLMKIGDLLSNGKKHDGRAPDYDDWSTVAENGKVGLNGDILIWYPVLGRSFELSSMGIRVDKESLLRQLEIEGKEDREKLYFHQQLLNDKLPLSIGGGFGQSRLCIVLLHKAHIGEIQASIWPEEMRKECAENGMMLI